jgi:hypothetical protein
MAKLSTFNAAAIASDAWVRINDKPSSISILRNDTLPLMAAQTVRIERGAIGDTASGGAGETMITGVNIFGVRDHQTVADTDIQRGDTFDLDGVLYQVTNVNLTLPGEIQASGKVIQ